MDFFEVVPETAVARGARLLLGALVVYAALFAMDFQKVFAGDADGIGALLQIIGTLFSVVYAFATYVIWGQFTSVENEILKEAGSLKDLVIFSCRLKPLVRDPLVRAVRIYAKAVSEAEWEALSRNDPTDRTDKLFNDIVCSVAEIKPEDDAERTVYARLLEIANQASAHRDERLSLSVKRIPRTLLWFVTVTALTILFLLFFYPFHNVAFGLVSIGITTALLYFAHFVVTDLDNPFEGAWNLSSDPFAELATKAR